MASTYKNLNINEIELDMDNPRIAKFIEMYDKESLNSEALALALGAGVQDDSQTNYNSLLNSIKTNQGIINPILVNHQPDGRFVVIEGNTRVQIYKEFDESGLKGDWHTIPSIVYENLSDNEIHAIRLQAHLVGPREWDPYSKAKYLHYLSNVECLPMQQIIDYCGGKKNEIMKSIKAYNDMEKYYRPQLSSDDEFDQKDFSKFIEVQRAKEILLLKGYSMEDFSKWVIQGNVESAYNVRKLPEVFKSEEGIQQFLKSNIEEAYKKVVADKPNNLDLKNCSINQLCLELSQKINEVSRAEIKRIKNDDDNIKNIIINLIEDLQWFNGEFE